MDYFVCEIIVSLGWCASGIWMQRVRGENNLNILFNYLMEMLPHSTWEGDTSTRQRQRHQTSKSFHGNALNIHHQRAWFLTVRYIIINFNARELVSVELFWIFKDSKYKPHIITSSHEIDATITALHCIEQIYFLICLIFIFKLFSRIERKAA